MGGKYKIAGTPAILVSLRQVPPSSEVIFEGFQVIDRIGIKQAGGVIIHLDFRDKPG